MTTARVSGLLFDDNNANGQFDSIDNVVDKEVTVQLLDANNNVLLTTKTDLNGQYEFDNLTSGSYKVRFLSGSGVQYSPKNVGDDATDSDVDQTGTTDVFTLYAGQNLTDVDAGCFKKPPLELAALGDRVFNDLDRDGIQDAGEPGVAGAVVMLKDENGNNLDAEVTDSQGNYLFENLQPGDYKIAVQAPSGFDGFSPQNRGTDETVDSDVNPTNGMSELVTLSSGEVNRDLDAGLIKKPESASVGDFVFNDLDGDGIQDSNEPGITNATVILQNPDGTNISTTTTDNNGIYHFNDLTPGSYKVKFVQPNGFDSASPFLVGGNRAIDSDANPNNNLMSQVFTLREGEAKKTIDAGFIATPEKVDVDLSIKTDGIALYSEGKNKIEIIQSGTLRQTITVTNNSGETATGVVVATDLQAGLDVWEPNQPQTEHGTDWVNSQGAEDKARFFGNPATVDPTNGNVIVNDVTLVGIDPKKLNTKVENLPKGELRWELGTPLAAGESATLTFYAQRTPYNTGGVEFKHYASVVDVDQHESNPNNNKDSVHLKFGTPIAFDLNGDGIQTISVDEGVQFDLLNTGVKVQTGWLDGEDALLAIDNNDDGQISDRYKLFGGDIGDGFAKLATFDSNNDGFVNALDAGFDELKVWQDKNENALTDDGELVSLEAKGITSLNTDYTNVFSTDAQGNIHGEHSSASLADGRTIDLVDVYFRVED